MLIEYDLILQGKHLQGFFDATGLFVSCLVGNDIGLGIPYEIKINQNPYFTTYNEQVFKEIYQALVSIISKKESECEFSYGWIKRLA